MSVVVKVSEGGRVAIPAELRKKYDISIGDSLVLNDDGQGFTLYSMRASIKRAQAIVAKYKRPGVSEVDEFIREKREEAARE